MTHEQATTTLAAERYLLDEMSEEERDAFEAHYFECAECAADVRAGGIMRDGVRAGLAAGGAAERSASSPSTRAGARVLAMPSRRWYQSAVIPWAAAAALALVAGYQSLVVVPGLRPLNEAQALAPVSLRPASRGAVPQVPVGRDAQAITLAVDMSDATRDVQTSYEIHASSGAVVASGRAAVPISGVPLLLLVPARAVRAPGRYVLSVAGVDYPFEVVPQ